MLKRDRGGKKARRNERNGGENAPFAEIVLMLVSKTRPPWMISARVWWTWRGRQVERNRGFSGEVQRSSARGVGLWEGVERVRGLNTFQISCTSPTTSKNPDEEQGAGGDATPPRPSARVAFPDPPPCSHPSHQKETGTHLIEAENEIELAHVLKHAVESLNEDLDEV